MKSIATILFTLCIYSSTPSTASSSKSSNKNNVISSSISRHCSAIQNHTNGSGGGSSNNNYSSGLNVVKSNNDDDGSTTTTDDDHDEYVTNFYRRKRQAKRDYLAAEGSINNGSGGGSNSHDDNDGLKHIQPAFVSKQHDHTIAQQHARVASSVRGGSIVAQHGRRKHSNYNCYYGSDKNNKKSGNGRLKDQRNHHDALATSTAHHHRRRHGHSHQTHHHHEEEEEESDVDQFLDNHDKEYLQATAKSDYSSTTNDDHQHDDDPNNNSAPPIHQAGLLRIPCSIRLNSNKADHSSHHPSSFTSSTPIAAYIDTGAQVTVISASAARKFGILHLMDRRCAGRATGVGSCRILGRIPAGCVQFVLGHDDDDEGEVIEMNGPALTVLEGTVTQGVDMLVGLDVLQDWEATIRMGGSSAGMGSSMMVRKRGRKDPVVLPFLVGSSSSSDEGRVGVKSRHRSATGAVLLLIIAAVVVAFRDDDNNNNVALLPNQNLHIIITIDVNSKKKKR
eukprot:scaffold12609_cov132-Skeletonema_dohrnii-CCMP3373.AAC.1